MRVLPQKLLISVLPITLYLVISATLLYAQEASPSASPSTSPTSSPSPSPTLTSTASGSITSPTPSPTSTPTPTPKDDKKEVLGETKVLGATSSGLEIAKWIAGGAIGILVLIIGFKITRSNVED